MTVHCDYIGGGFGSKFAADRWDVLAAKMSKDLGRPVKLMLDRDLELKNAGCRPSGFVERQARGRLARAWSPSGIRTTGATGGMPAARRRRRTSCRT